MRAQEQRAWGCGISAHREEKELLWRKEAGNSWAQG